LLSEIAVRNLAQRIACERRGQILAEFHANCKRKSDYNFEIRRAGRLRSKPYIVEEKQ
jgi:hypothetical protein